MIKQTDLTLSELKSYRIKLCRDAASFKKPDRIPHISFYITWPILDSGYKLSEALYDWDIMEKVMKEHQERYNFDAIQCLGTRNPMKITEACGMTVLNHIWTNYQKRKSKQEFIFTGLWIDFMIIFLIIPKEPFL